MLRALMNAASGVKAQSVAIDTIANNIANVNTNGYKKERPVFAELVHQSLQQQGLPVQEGNVASPPQIGTGSRVASSIKVFSPGQITQTGRVYDLAVAGKGMFQVELPDGEKALTRDGAFRINDQREIVTTSGYRMHPAITLPEGYTDILIDPSGNVSVVDNEGKSTALGRITLVNVINLGGLKPLGDNLLGITSASGPPAVGFPGEDGLGSIRQGFLELSNVDMAEEMSNLIITQRAFEINSKAIQTADEMWSMANNLRK
ncbi:MAG: flagellar basal-body rod protein FlgG [Bacillota bacterium]